MPTEKSSYPWFFFFKIIQISSIAFLPAFLWFIWLDRLIFIKVFPVLIICYLLFLALVYRSIVPIGNILKKVEKFKGQIPFKTKLNLFYKRDEWANIEEALKKAEETLWEQTVQAKVEQEKMLTILDSISDNIIAIDNFESVMFCNPKFEKNFKQDKDSSTLINKVWHVFSDEHVLIAFREVLKTGMPQSLETLKNISPSHPQNYFNLTVTALHNNEGTITGALGVLYDVTDFIKTQQMRVDFVANVSHEIRTPLTSIKGFTQILQGQKDKIDGNLHLFLDKIISNTERMISLFNDLLNLSVIESKNEMSRDRISLQPMLESSFENVKTLYPLKKIIISYDLSSTEILGDRRLLEQVISNLFDNACKYCDKSEIHIRVKCYLLNEVNVISIQDNGPGIPQESIHRIFERFYRIDSSRESTKGTGLGLSIVKHIIQKHHGKIWAQNLNEGTEFIFELPQI
jgi:two-component system phosphate regulon sensor histidine kinase PhoR